MQKNDVIQLHIQDLGIHGEGIGHADGLAIFVPGAIPGDDISCGITKVKKSFAYGRVINVDQASPDRVTPKCPVARKCGGCQLQEMDYQAELKWKETHVHNLLTRIGGFSEDLIQSVMEPIIGMEEPWRYRNKAQYPIGFDKNGRIIAGFYGAHSHRIVEAEDCLLGDEANRGILAAVIKWMNRNRIKPYDEETGQGMVRHVLIRQAVHTEETMVCLVCNGSKIPAVDSLVDGIRSADPRFISLSLNVNRERSNVILGRETKTLWGEETITDTIGGIAFQISPRSFFQVNPLQMEKLYQKALDYADLTGEENVYDLYCGIGTISLFLAKAAGHVTGVEIVPEAISDAKENANRNGITNADFYCGATEDVLPKLITEGKSALGSLSQEEKRMEAFLKEAEATAEGRDGSARENGLGYISGRRADVIVLDPPRKGCEESVLDAILGAEPKRIVYVSCDPATLARDLKILCGSGQYQLERVCPVDQFGHTVHVESCVLLQRVSNTR
ncbi:MAG: 23S rRNA (uracil(1939)-C(5))-methyltransferase RlmD [Lachnospiraceae bacterium]|nr:23S rRNA (uracil(1939)-C(5))-methyltransferase RlmD [Lachnospiraceae bacterium]